MADDNPDFGSRFGVSLRATKSLRPFMHVAAALGVADLLAHTSLTSEELAKATQTHPPTLYRRLRALATVDVLRELDGRRFRLTPLGERLRSDVPD